MAFPTIEDIARFNYKQMSRWRRHLLGEIKDFNREVLKYDVYARRVGARPQSVPICIVHKQTQSGGEV